MYVLIIQSAPAKNDDLIEVVHAAGFSSRIATSLAELSPANLPEDLRLVCIDVNINAQLQIDLCKEIRSTPHLQMLPLVVLSDSAEAGENTRKNALKSGATEVLARDDLGALRRSFDEYAHRFRHDKLAGQVLLVEDDELLSGLICAHLESRGLQVDHCSSAEQAMLRFYQHSYDLVITDIVLEGAMTGLALLRSIRANSKSETRIPVLVISAFDDPARKLEILYSGADDYLPKPLEPLELLTRAGNMLRAKFMCDAIREQKEELKVISTTDLLTGLYNKRYLYESGASMLSNAHRHGESLSMMVIDLDKFKPINDRHGHDVGDMVLARIGKTIKSMVRSGDVAARFGGDEFVVLLSHSDMTAAREKGEDFCAAIRELNPCDMTVTASIGITEYRKECTPDFFSLFREADLAVYQAKKLGGNQVSLSPEAAT